MSLVSFLARYDVGARYAAALAVAALACGCTPKGEFPSLAPRPLEAEDPLAEPVRAPPVVAGEPALRARAAELVALARRGESAFDDAYRPAAAATRRAGAPGSDSWVLAEQAISRAEAARAPTMAALAELDRLAAERAAVPTNEGDTAAIRAALDEAENLARGQQARLDALRASVRR
ncbi:MAG TPA: hypothetical protein VF702_02035 [Allosphingosinicella sp.]|jgi:hypothetical protein